MKIKQTKVTPQMVAHEAEVWVTPSTSDPGRKHYTVIGTDAYYNEVAMCSCMGYQHHGYCWHIRDIHDRLKNENA